MSRSAGLDARRPTGARSEWTVLGPVLISSSLLAASFQLLLPVVPVLLQEHGPPGTAGIGTAAVFAGMVTAEFLSPLLMSRVPATLALALGGIVMGVPSFFIGLPGVPPAVTISLVTVRGLGMGTGVVATVVVAMAASTHARRGRAIGLVGLASGVPGIVLPSAGVALVDSGYTYLPSLIAATAATLGAAVAGWLARKAAVADEPAHFNPFTALRSVAARSAAGLLAVTNLTFGGLITYIPLTSSRQGLASAAALLLSLGCLRAVGRWLAGFIGDRIPMTWPLASAVVLTICGLLLVGVRGGAAEIPLAGAAAYGLGSGAVQTFVYLRMAETTPRSDRNSVSALWNAALDVGSAVGGGVLGVSAALYGLQPGYWLLPILLIAATPLVYAARPQPQQSK